MCVTKYPQLQDTSGTNALIMWLNKNKIFIIITSKVDKCLSLNGLINCIRIDTINLHDKLSNSIF